MTKSQNILVLGGASWNTMIYLDELPNGRPQTIANAKFVEGAGSTGIGKAFALKQLGYDPLLHVALGDDGEGQKLVAACRQRDIRLLVDWDDAPTPQHVNLMDKEGQRISIFRQNGLASPQIDLAGLRPHIAAAETIFLNITASSVPILSLLGEAGAKIYVDLHDYDGTNQWHEQFIAVADMVQFSDEQLDDPDVIVNRLLKMGVELVVLTKGKAGAALYTSREKIVVPAMAAKVKDTNGAGDTFGVALLHGLSEGLALADAGKFAAAAATLCVQSFDIVPTNMSIQSIQELAAK